MEQHLVKKDDKKIKCDNEILHRSKVIKHLLSEDVEKSRTEKDFKSVYKKIKRNQQYIIAIKLGEPKILSFAEMQKILDKVKNYKSG